MASVPLAWAYEIVGDPPPVIVPAYDPKDVTAQMTVLDRTHALGAGQGTHGRFFPELSRLQHGVAASAVIGAGSFRTWAGRLFTPHPFGRSTPQRPHCQVSPGGKLGIRGLGWPR
jgi:hypothetical protein